MLTAIISKNDTNTVEKIKKAIEKAKEEGVIKKWKGIVPENLHLPLRDGDITDKPEFKNSFYISAKSKTAPEIVDQFLKPIYDKGQIYSGCYARVSMVFYPYMTGINKGVSAVLGNIQLVKAGERLGGAKSASEDFGMVEEQPQENLESMNEG